MNLLNKLLFSIASVRLLGQHRKKVNLGGIFFLEVKNNYLKQLEK